MARISQSTISEWCKFFCWISQINLFSPNMEHLCINPLYVMFEYQLSCLDSSISSQASSLTIIHQSSAEYCTNSSPYSCAKNDPDDGSPIFETLTSQMQCIAMTQPISILSRYTIGDSENVDPNLPFTSKTVSKKSKYAGHPIDDQSTVISKLEIMRELKLFKVFKAWQTQCGSKARALIEQEEAEWKHQIIRKYTFFKEWKNVTIVEKRAGQFHRKKIYRIFFMTCSQLLQLRLRTIYLQELIKLSAFPDFMTQLKHFKSKELSRALKCVRKFRIDTFLKSARHLKIRNNIVKMSKLSNELRVKKKCWRILLQQGTR